MDNNEIKFLIALNASEEAYLFDIVKYFSNRPTDTESVLHCFREMILEEIVGIYSYQGEEITDLSNTESLNAIQHWESLKRQDLQLFLTPKGEKVWDEEDWELTKKHAQKLMFEGNGFIKTQSTKK